MDKEDNKQFITAQEAAERWGETVDYVYKVCRYYHLTKSGFPARYNIPIDLSPIIILDGRFKGATYKEWLYVIRAIIENKVLVPELFNSNDQRIRTIVAQLHNAGIITPLIGAEKNTLDYRCYQITLGYFGSDWAGLVEKDKYALVSKLAESITKGATDAILDKYG